MIGRYLIYFFILSFIGYIYECIAMTFWIGKWDNRGFLFGPVIPIYGAGALGGTILFNHFYTDYTPWSILLVGMIGSAIMEYIVHYAMEKMFHACWWDYSKAPLNINGRICLPATVGFGIASLVIVYVINPFVLPLISRLNDLTVEIVSLVMVVIFTADLTLTVSILSSFSSRVEAMDNFINEHMEALIGNVLDESDAWNYRFYNAVDRLDERRKRLINDRIEKVSSSMSSLYQRSLSRIKKYTGKNADRMNYMLDRIRNRIRKKTDGNE